MVGFVVGRVGFGRVFKCFKASILCIVKVHLDCLDRENMTCKGNLSYTATI